MTIWQASLQEPFMTFKIHDQEVSEFTFQVVVLIVAQLILAGVFIYLIDLFRKLVRSFFKPKLFTKFQVTRLNLIGLLIIFTSFGDGILNFFAGAILQEKTQVGFTIENNFGSFWFTLGLGLFFILLSKAFENARILKEENELTV